MSTKTSAPQSGDAARDEAKEVAAITIAAARLKIVEARRRLSELADDLISAEPKKIPRLMHQMQRQRVIIMTLSEVVNGTMDGDLHREIALLAKIDVAGLDDDNEVASAERVEAASMALAARGISPEAAARIARVLSTASVTLPAVTSVLPPSSVTLPVVSTGVSSLEPDPDFAAAGDEPGPDSAGT